MKALSVRAPWWWFILFAGKNIENREWKTAFRGTIYLHASKTMPEREMREDLHTACVMAGWRSDPRHWPDLQAIRADAGRLVGTVEIIDCVEQSSSPWFQGRYGLVLRNPLPLRETIPCKGALGLFEVAKVDGCGAEGNLSLFGEGA